jgi:hypothetical protein
MTNVWRNNKISTDGNNQSEFRVSINNDNDSRNQERLEKQADLSNVKTFNQHKEQKEKEHKEKEHKEIEHKEHNKVQHKQRRRIF